MKDYTSNQSNHSIIGINEMTKHQLTKMIIYSINKGINGQSIPSGYFDISRPIVSETSHYHSSNDSNRRKGRRRNYG